MLIHNVRHYVEGVIRVLQIFLDAIVTYLTFNVKNCSQARYFFHTTFFECCSGDTELFRIGELSFNEQFAAMETVPTTELGSWCVNMLLRSYEIHTLWIQMQFYNMLIAIINIHPQDKIYWHIWVSATSEK